MNKAAAYRFANVGGHKVFYREARDRLQPTITLPHGLLWGKRDPFFVEAGAQAYLDDLPRARLVWLDAGPFVLDENAVFVAVRSPPNSPRADTSSSGRPQPLPKGSLRDRSYRHRS